MLLLKVVVTLSIYQHYCVGSSIFHPNYVDEYQINNEDHQITDDKDFTTNPEEIQTTVTRDEFTTESDENQTTVGDLTTKPDENPTTVGDLTTKPDENPTTVGDLTTKPDENPTTDGDLTTKPDENPTTESDECPSEKSIYSKKDIRDIIDYIFNDLELNKKMVEHIVPQAKNINQKLTEDFQQFEEWFQNQPEHLKDVLQGLSAVRKNTIEPEAQKIAVILKDYPQVKENIDAKLLKFNQLSKKINKYENLCKYMCEDEESEPSHIFKRSIPEEHLCSSIVDLHNQIKKEFTENFDGFLNKLQSNLVTTNQTFTETIETIKTNLKEGALKEFGRTMYDVLNLEDEYHSFVKEINSTNTQILMYAVKEGGLQIDSKLLELGRLVENYGDYCRNCHKGPVKRSVRHTKLVININENSKDPIVHELIQDKYNESENEFNKTIEETFKDLINKIYDPKIIETYLNNLKLKQKGVVEVASIERKSLEHLKSIASPGSVQKLSELDSFSKDLLKNIDDKITDLKKIII